MRPGAIAVALALITLLFAPFQMSAKSAEAGSDIQPSEPTRIKLTVSPRHWYYYDSYDGKDRVMTSTYALTCARTREAVTVVSSDAETSDVTVTSSVPTRPARGLPDAGTRKVTITRC